MAQANRIPISTWSGKLFNYGEVDIDILSSGQPTGMIYEKNDILSPMRDSIIQAYADVFSSIRYGIGNEFTGQNTGNYSSGCFIHSTKKTTEPIFIRFEPDEQGSIVDHNILVAEPDSEISVIMNYPQGCSHNGITKIWAKPRSKVKLVKVHAQKQAQASLDACGVLVEDGADVEAVSIDLGTQGTFINHDMTLRGDNATGTFHSLYFGSRLEKLDLNYRIIFEGKNGCGTINVNGILKEQAVKNFRGTLDFKRGCAGSEGNESETVTLLDESVHSVSVPLMLCQEDDVAGAHAATAGRLDDEAVFYLLSRGISKTKAKKMIIFGKCAPVIDKISDAKLREDIYSLISEKIEEKS